MFNNKEKVTMPVQDTFGEVEKGSPLIIKDDYGRVEIALNQGNFMEKYKIKKEFSVEIKKV